MTGTTRRQSTKNDDNVVRWRRWEDHDGRGWVRRIVADGASGSVGGRATKGGGARLRISGMGLQGRKNATRQESARTTGVDGGEGHRAAISQ